MSEYTKGPWLADIRGGICAVYPERMANDTNGLHHDDERNIYCSTSGAKYNGKNWEMSKESIANANLIAAAPDMLEALEEAITSMVASGYPVSHVAIKAGLKAIAKAKGESK